MSTRLGQLLRARRKALDIGLRELARRIDKSPAYVVSLERSEQLPGAADETLSALAIALEVNVDEVMAAAGRMPAELIPDSPIELALYRLIGRLTPPEREALLAELVSRFEPQDESTEE